MSTRTLDGAQLHDAGIDWTWNEDVDDEGQRGGWWSCDRCCDGIAQGDASRAAHVCETVCCQCGKQLVWHYFDGTHAEWITEAEERSSTFCSDSDDNVHVAECDQ